jgi:hypothetical protein
LSFAGTDDLHDFVTDVKNAKGYLTDQYSAAMKLADQFVSEYGEGSGNTNLEFVGHSLGGGLATAASAVTGIRATTFNPAGVSDDVVASHLMASGLPSTIRNIRPDQITTYRIAGELVTTNQDFFPGLVDTVGRQVTLEPPRDESSIPTGWIGTGVKRHFMSNFMRVLEPRR